MTIESKLLHRKKVLEELLESVEWIHDPATQKFWCPWCTQYYRKDAARPWEHKAWCPAAVEMGWETWEP